MALDPGVLILVLLAAVLHASWNALIKAGGDRLVMTCLVMLAPAVPSAAALVFLLPPLQAEAWPFLLLSAVVHYFYFAVLLGAYHHGDLSQVYPIARGAAPAVVAVEAWVFANEGLSAVELAGVAVVSLGIMSLAWRRRGALEREAKAIGFALLTALSIAIYLLADGMGVRRAGFALTYICWLFVLEAVPLLALTLWLRRGRIVDAFAPHLPRGLAGGAIAGISYGIAIWAMGVAPMAHVVAVRETSVVFGAAIGALFLREPFGRFRIAASAVVASGAVLLNLGG